MLINILFNINVIYYTIYQQCYITCSITCLLYNMLYNMLYSMCTLFHSFLDRNFILSSRFWHWEIIQQSLQIIRCDLCIPFMSAARARSMSQLVCVWGGQAHLGPFHSLPSPCNPLGPLAVAAERDLGEGSQLELQRHTKSQIISFWNVQKQFILKEIYLIC